MRGRVLGLSRSQRRECLWEPEKESTLNDSMTLNNSMRKQKGA